MNVPDYSANKVAFGLRNNVMPSLDEIGLTEQTAWDELCSVRLSAHEHIPQEAHDEAEKFLEGLPRPIIAIHSRGTNWHERKSIPTEVAFEVILKLLDQTGGSVVVLDFDRRAPMVGDERCKGIKPSWGHIGVDRLCALYERIDLMIGVDSGPFHVAAMTPVKALGVFRTLHPNRVCLPNPNAVYLASDRYEEQWQSRRDRWNIVTYHGGEPTADDITNAAVSLLNCEQATKMVSMNNDRAKFAGRYQYYRVGHDRRFMRLEPDGTISEGAQGCEQRWSVAGDTISISGKDGVICRCEFDGKIYRGRWTQFEKMPIELIPVDEHGIQSVYPAKAAAIAPATSITLVMNWDAGYDSVAQVILPNRRQYAAKHGCQIRETSHEGAWGKLNALLDAWDSADWLWWLDADACITNLDVSLQSIISQVDSNARVIITCDRNGINCGSMLIRPCPEVRAIFEDLLKRRVEFDWPNGLWEQNGMMWMFWKIKDRVCVVPQQTMNSYPKREKDEGSHQWQAGDFVLHCAGLTNQQRIEVLTAALNGVSIVVKNEKKE